MVLEAVERPPHLLQSASRLRPTPITDRLKVFRTTASMPNALATVHDDTAIAQWFLLVRCGSYKAVQKCLREGWALVNATDKAGYTALMHCCVSGRLLEALLGCSEVNVNLRANDGNTALHLAARYRSASTVHALLRRGAAFTRDVSGCSVLHKAAANSDPAVVQLLLQTEVDPCVRDRDGRCALATALLHCNEGAAVALLLWQKSWAASDVGAAVGVGPAGGKGGDGSGAGWVGGGSGAGGGCSGAGLDSLPDDCVELIMGWLSARACGGRGPLAAVPSCESSCEPSCWAASRSPPPPLPLPTIAAASVPPGAMVGASVGGMACACIRFRTLSRRRAVLAWVSAEGVNASVKCFHPRGQSTTLMHLAVAEGMERAVELLLERGACLLALDSWGRTPLQVARADALLITKLAHEQAEAVGSGR